jgi:Papain-like cysteine protease AvrRpt2
MPLKIAVGTPINIPPLAPGAPGAAPSPMLPVPYIKQGQTNWCWAACCEMVFKYSQVNNVQQCDMATFTFGGNCCQTPSSAGCNQGQFPPPIYANWGFLCDETDAALSQDDVKAELNAQRPVEVYYAWDGGGGAHVALIRGYYDNGDFEVSDPWYGPGPHSYDDILNACQNGGQWTMTYSNLHN